MRIMTLAAGLATGYVLGTRAGREKYEQIATAARRFSAGPLTAQAEGSKPVTEPVAAPAVVTPVAQSAPEVAGAKPRRPRNRRTNMPTADNGEESARTPLPLESNAADVQEQRRSL